MRLTSITARNYRTLENIQLTFSKSYCTISGKNNAGKSCVIRLLSTLFRVRPAYPWSGEEPRFDYKEDKTQWVKQALPIKVDYVLELTKEEDPALISFIEKIAGTKLERPTASLGISYTVSEADGLTVTLLIDDHAADEKAAKEVEKRIRDSNLLFLYNSTTPHEDYFYSRGRRRMFYEFVMSEEEKKELDEAGKRSERRLRQLAKGHTQGLSTMLGRLSERYSVELSPPESFTARRMPLGINLKDRSVEVPLNDWGSGTFSSYRSRVLLVEGEIDREYFEFLRKHRCTCDCLAEDIEVVPYGGKDTLKNTLLVQFVLRKFDNVFVTFDLDAENEVRAALLRLGLKEHVDFMALGIGQPGKDCLEGLLPQRVLAAVNGRETDLVMKLGSKDNKERRKAKDALKRKYLDEFKSHTDYSKDEIRDMAKAVKTINAKLGQTKTGDRRDVH